MAFWGALVKGVTKVAGSVFGGASSTTSNSSLQATVEQQNALINSYQNTIQELKSSYSSALDSANKKSDDTKKYIMIGGAVFLGYILMNTLGKGRF